VRKDLKRALDQKEEEIQKIRIFLTKKFYLGKSLEEILRRPEITFEKLEEFCPELQNMHLSNDVKEQAEIEIKYQGYIQRQNEEIERFKRLEAKAISKDFDYSKVRHLRFEAREKLSKIRPISLGQASRISGVSPADISVLLAYLRIY
jgi:tRNA uridine 5-carboxymethylaminomethyl modification enzyme